jgi:hypothetical protein
LGERINVNPYSYVANNPLRLKDPFGLFEVGPGAGQDSDTTARGYPISLPPPPFVPQLPSDTELFPVVDSFGNPSPNAIPYTPTPNTNPLLDPNSLNPYYAPIEDLIENALGITLLFLNPALELPFVDIPNGKPCPGGA